MQRVSTVQTMQTMQTVQTVPTVHFPFVHMPFSFEFYAAVVEVVTVTAAVLLDE